MSDRYVLRELTGYPIGGVAGRPGNAPAVTDFYIFDSFYGFAIVQHMTARHNRRPDVRRKMRAACVALNEASDDV